MGSEFCSFELELHLPLMTCFVITHPVHLALQHLRSPLHLFYTAWNNNFNAVDITFINDWNTINNENIYLLIFVLPKTCALFTFLLTYRVTATTLKYKSAYNQKKSNSNDLDSFILFIIYLNLSPLPIDSKWAYNLLIFYPNIPFKVCAEW